MSAVIIHSVLLVGVLAISSAAILIRMIDGPALAIVFYRLAIAGLMVTPMAIVKDYGSILKRPSVHSLVVSSVGCCTCQSFFYVDHVSRAYVGGEFSCTGYNKPSIGSDRFFRDISRTNK